MPSKKILIGGIAAIALAAAVYLLARPERDDSLPVSREELAQELKGLDFKKLQGEEREKAIRHLQEMFKHIPLDEEQRGPAGPLRDPAVMKAMLSLRPEERRRIMAPSRDRIRQVIQQRMEAFFKKSPEEQTADLDRILDMLEFFEERRKTMSGKRAGLPGRGPRSRNPDDIKKRVTTMIRWTNSETRAKRQEFVRRLFNRWTERKAMGITAAARRAARKAAASRKDKPPVITGQVVVEQPVKEQLDKLKVGDPVSIVNMPGKDGAPRMVVARMSNRIGKLPAAESERYAGYISDHRRIWARVLEVRPDEAYLLIEATVR